MSTLAIACTEIRSSSLNLRGLMLNATLRRIPTAISVLAIIAAAYAVWMPGTASGQHPWDDCYYDDGSDEWACADTPHIYQGQCEGTDCYTSMEFCCIRIE